MAIASLLNKKAAPRTLPVCQGYRHQSYRSIRSYRRIGGYRCVRCYHTPQLLRTFTGGTGLTGPSQPERTYQYKWYINKLNASLANIESHHAKLRKKLTRYSQHFPLSMDSLAGEAMHDAGTGAASHGPKPVSDGDKARVAQIQELAHKHNRILEMEASAKRNMAAAGIKSEKHLDALLRKLDKNSTDEEATKEMVDPYALAGELAASPLDNSRLGIARRCGKGAEIYKIGGYTVGDSEMAFAQTWHFAT